MTPRILGGLRGGKNVRSRGLKVRSRGLTIGGCSVLRGPRMSTAQRKENVGGLFFKFQFVDPMKTIMIRL